MKNKIFELIKEHKIGILKNKILNLKGKILINIFNITFEKD